MSMPQFFDYAKWWLSAKFGHKSPLVNTVIIHYGCNLRCKHCSIYANLENVDKDVKTKLTYDEVVACLQREFNNGARIAYFEGGETTLWKDDGKDLGDLIKVAKSIGYHNVGYTTNGTNRIYTESDIISVSLDGPKEVHDLIRGAGVFDKLMENLRTIDFSGHIYANMVIQKDNYDSILETAQIVRDNPDISGIIFNFITPPPHDIAISPAMKQEAVELISRLKKEGYPILNSKHGLRILSQEDWEFNCPHYLSTFTIPDGSTHSGCPMRGTESCKKCGFAAVREYHLIDIGDPATILEMSSMFAMSKKSKK